MKLLALLILSFVVLIQCIPLEAAADFDLASRDIEKSNSRFNVATLPNGRHVVTVYDEGKYDGVIVEKDDGECIVYDKDGKVVELDDLEDDDESGLQRRQRATILIKLAKFIARFGQRAWVSRSFEFLTKDN